jgi:hypothetical protein
VGRLVARQYSQPCASSKLSPCNLGLWGDGEKGNLGSVRGITAEGGLVDRFRGGGEGE